MDLARKSDKLRVVRVADVSPQGEAFAREREIPFAASFEQTLADPQVQGVVLCTPHSQHTDQIVAAAKAGKHVFCEKPLSMSRADVLRAVAAVEQAIQGRSGAAAVGAVEQITHVHGIKIEDTAAGLRILDRSLDCLNARLVPWENLKEFKQSRWLATHGAGTW